MNVLGLDTATPDTVAGLLRADGEAFEVRDEPGPGERPAHAGRLLAAAEEALERAGVAWEDVGRLAVGVGPGGFTGLRIGIATARGLAQARGLPLVPVSTLQALARGASHDGIVLAALDARRGEAFAGAWRGEEAVLPAAALPPEALARRAASLAPGLLAVGDGAVRFRQQLEGAGAVVPPDGAAVHRLRAVHVCQLGAEGSPIARDALLPDYLREPDAVPRR